MIKLINYTKVSRLFIAVLFLLVSVSSNLVYSNLTAYADGSIEIDSCSELRLIGDDEEYPLDGNYKLTKNIDCSPEEVAIGSTIYSEDFESGALEWTTGGQDNEGMANTWRLTNQTCELDVDGEQVGPFNFSSTVYGTNGNAGPDCVPESNDEDSYIMSPVISLPQTDIGWVVQFDSWSYDEGGPCVDEQSIDSKDIAITLDGGSSATPLNNCYDIHGETSGEDDIDYKLQKFSISPYAEQDIQLMFRYYTNDSCCELDLGWFVDNVTIYEGVIDTFFGIGTSDNYFTGVFDGQSYSISNLNVEANESFGNYTGLFNYVDDDSEIKNIKLESGVVEATTNSVGGLVGRNYGTITNSHSKVDVHGDDRTGGLVGRNNGTIYSSSSTGSVYGEDYTIGGLVGLNNGIIEKSWSNNKENEDGYGVDGYCDVGGLVGENREDARIANSFSRSDIRDRDNCEAGGLVGETEDYSDIINSYSTGSVDGEGNVGGLIGYANDDSNIQFSFYDRDTSGIENGCGYEEDPLDCESGDRVFAKTTAEMKQKSTFTTALGENSWDFDTIWRISSLINDGYPFFSGQNDSSNIISLNSAVDGSKILIEQSGCSAIEDTSVFSEQGLIVKDSGFDYPLGFVGFSLTGCSLGGVATVIVTYTGSFDPSEILARKYNPSFSLFTNIEGVNVTETTLDDKEAISITYSLVDGGSLDQDGSANGTIVDPVGLGISVTGSPNTGVSDYWLFKTN